MDCFERTWRKKKNMDWSRKSAIFIYYYYYFLRNS